MLWVLSAFLGCWHNLIWELETGRSESGMT